MENPIFVSIRRDRGLVYLDIVNEEKDDSVSVLIMEFTSRESVCPIFREKAKEIARVLDCEIQDDL